MKKRLLLLAAVFVLFSGFTLSWDPVTKYTDNTVIGTEAQGIFYNVEMDGVIASGRFSGNSWNIPAVPKATAHTFRARTELGALDNTGQPYRSAWSPSYGWTSPLVTPGLPGNLRVAP
jgi:hypothetical protein